MFPQAVQSLRFIRLNDEDLVRILEVSLLDLPGVGLSVWSDLSNLLLTRAKSDGPITAELSNLVERLLQKVNLQDLREVLSRICDVFSIVRFVEPPSAIPKRLFGLFESEIDESLLKEKSLLAIINLYSQVNFSLIIAA